MRYNIRYEDWSKENLIKLSELLNNRMSGWSGVYSDDKEETRWLREFQDELDALIDEVCKD